VIVVSEESGFISLAIGGVLEKDLKSEALEQRLLEYLNIK